ncbi:hypothetical protein UFOVP1604_184 [uncultured Caudovirales phage]|uniref:Uncharacterized protein n=1 Tax=uncultured Caudovirales phage TaxID=2100421 RepID=A0A6J5SWU4_9CAUD|nr:hypothetical protein UFOVP1604_184 [uncultured Caudovirales phage]
MEIRLTTTESEEIFHTALCNALGYVQGYGIELDFFKQDYERASSALKKESPGTQICYEDVLLRLLKDGKELTMVDHECDGEYTRSISIKDVHERVSKTPIRHLMNMINEEDDAETADVVLQTVFFEDVIFG